MDWTAWHANYDQTDSPLRRRLEIVQTHIRRFLAACDRSPVRVISICAGEGRDLLGAVASQDRRDIVGRLVEMDPRLASIARGRALSLGLPQLQIAVADAGMAAAYEGAVPADLVLVCGVFGNISDTDVERVINALPTLSAAGATAIWTRHRRPPDLTVSIREWFTAAGFRELSFEPVPDSSGSVGVARYEGGVRPMKHQNLFSFTRRDRDRGGRWG